MPSYKHWSHYSPEQDPLMLSWRLGGPRTGVNAVEKRKFYVLLEYNLRFSGCEDHIFVTIMTELLHFVRC
jgi:hypothetical protein